MMLRAVLHIYNIAIKLVADKTKYLLTPMHNDAVIGWIESLIMLLEHSLSGSLLIL